MITAPLLFLSATDMIVIAVIALFLFGGRKIPEFAKGLGQSIKQFKDATADKPEDDKSSQNPNSPKK
jgi:sec-independent protein translocase protein TatA